MRRERQPGEQPHGAGELRLHEIAHIAVDIGVKIWTYRLMDVTHAKGLGVRQDGLIPERRVEHNIPWGEHTHAVARAPSVDQTKSWCSWMPSPQASNPVG